MDGSIDSPALALFNPPAPAHKQRPPLSAAPRHFVSRALHNLRQGNVALFIVFCGCFIIFVRALFGAGYDEAFSADADAAVQKHPSILARWGPQSQHALEQQWRRLRGRSSSGLWAKIRKEDEGSSTGQGQHAPGVDALHWLRVMEDRALVGLGRRPHDAPASTDTPADVAADAEGAADAVAQAPLAARPDAPAAPVQPEHDISEDLDEHDAPDEDELHHAAQAPPVPVLKQHEEAAPPPPAVAETTIEREAPAPAPASAAESSSSIIAPAQVSPASPEIDPEHDDTDDEPVYHKVEVK